MSNRITWRNVAAPDFSSAVASQKLVGDMLGSGFDGLAGVGASIRQREKDSISAQAMAAAQGFNSISDWDRMMSGSQGFGGLGINASDLTPEALEYLQGRRANILADDQSVADIAFTNAETRNTNAETRNTDARTAGQYIRNEGFGIDNRQAAFDLSADKWRFGNEQTDRQNAVDTAAFSTPHIQNLQNLNSVAEQRAYIEQHKDVFAANPMLINPTLQGILSEGGMEAATDETANVGYDRSTEAVALYNQVISNPDLFHMDKGTLQTVLQNSGKPQAIIEEALGMLGQTSEARFTANPTVTNAVDSLPVVQAARQAVEERQMSHTAKIERDPTYSLFSFLEREGGTEGLYQELYDGLNSKEGLVYGQSGAASMQAIETYHKNNPEVSKDLIAAAILSGNGVNARNIIGRAIPFRADFVISAEAIDAFVQEAMSARADPVKRQHYLALKAEQESIDRLSNTVEGQISGTALELTLGNGQDAALNRLTTSLAGSLNLDNPLSNLSTQAEANQATNLIGNALNIAAQPGYAVNAPTPAPVPEALPDITNPSLVISQQAQQNQGNTTAEDDKFFRDAKKLGLDLNALDEETLKDLVETYVQNGGSFY